jgi:SAM-dependent methyltransferase
LVGERLAEVCDVRWDERVLDVAAGNGNATTAAAAAGRTSTDYVAALLERGAERARRRTPAGALPDADAESPPFGDAAFDVVLSIGVMFARITRRPPRAGMHCRPGGASGLRHWTCRVHRPDVQDLGKHLPPPAVCSPRRCGARGNTCGRCSATRSAGAGARVQFPLPLRGAFH